jgi:integrase
MKFGKLPLRGRIYPLKDRPGYTVKFYEGSARKERRVPEDLPDHQVFAYAREFLTTRAAELRRGDPSPASPTVVSPEIPTFKDFAQRWTSGTLHVEFPDYVAVKKTGDDDEIRLARHVYAVIGDIRISEFVGERGLQLAEQVMRQLSSTISQPTRRHVAQAMRRVLRLAAYPARYIPSCPLPDGFVPAAKTKKAVAFLYPDEEAALIACKAVPLLLRLLYGFLAREGMRVSEAVRLDWSDLDLHRGVVRLDVNKTSDPRSWSLRADTTKALRRWAIHSGSRVGLVFREPGSTKPMRSNPLAKLLRRHLALAGVERPELFVVSENRVRLRAHDLRATFVTLALANGKTEAWVMSRTGHRSSQMLQRYRRAVDLVTELGLGDLLPLHETIPELAAVTITTEEQALEAAR